VEEQPSAARLKLLVQKQPLDLQLVLGELEGLAHGLERNLMLGPERPENVALDKMPERKGERLARGRDHDLRGLRSSPGFEYRLLATQVRSIVAGSLR